MAAAWEGYSSGTEETSEHSSDSDLEEETRQPLSKEVINALMGNDVDQMKFLHEGYSSGTEETSEHSSASDLEEETRQPLSKKVIKALMANDVDQLKSLHEAGESFSCCDERGNTLLHLAIMGQAERNTRKKSRKFRTLHTSRKAAFNYLVTLDEIPKDAKNARGASVLMEAFSCLQDDPEWAVKLIEAGCDIYELFKDGNSCLHWAIENEWSEVAELLIEKGFDVNIRNKSQETPLHLACRFGLVDEIWMLLFYGADPNMVYPIDRPIEGIPLDSSSSGRAASCFDVAVGQFVKPEVQEIMLDQLTGYSKHFTLSTVIELMKNNVEIFHKLMKVASKINYSEEELHEFCREISILKPELFRILIEKFDYIILDMFGNCWLEELFLGLRQKKNLPTFSENMFTVFESGLVDDMVRTLYSYSGFGPPLLVGLVKALSYRKANEDTLTQLICCMLSYGVRLTAEVVDAIYNHFGYCDLFKMMLHMDIRERYELIHVVPRIIYDVGLGVQSLIAYCRYTRMDNRNEAYMLFDHFALPKMVEHCMYQRDLYLERKEWLKETIFRGEVKDDVAASDLLLQKVSKLPVVPSLVELARNRARDHIIRKYKTQNSRQFYTVLDRLPIAKIHKQIISFEKKLYA